MLNIYFFFLGLSKSGLFNKRKGKKKKGEKEEVNRAIRIVSVCSSGRTPLFLLCHISICLVFLDFSCTMLPFVCVYFSLDQPVFIRIVFNIMIFLCLNIESQISSDFISSVFLLFSPQQWSYISFAECLQSFVLGADNPSLVQTM